MSMTARSYGSKANTNGNQEHPAETSSTQHAAAAASTSQDIQVDLQTLQQDVARLGQQLASLVGAKGSEAWELAKDNIDTMLTDAGAKGKKAADSVGDMRDNIAAAIEDSIENRPYMTLALTLAAGFVAGAMWKR
jgi:ElaB/YqjD/DUF883 family membrane-anchored ribosome-binding protein